MAEDIGVVFKLKGKCLPAVVLVANKYGMAVYGAKRCHELIKTCKSALNKFKAILHPFKESSLLEGVILPFDNSKDNMSLTAGFNKIDLTGNKNSSKKSNTYCKNEHIWNEQNSFKMFANIKYIFQNNIKQSFKNVGIGIKNSNMAVFKNLCSEIQKRFTQVKSEFSSVTLHSGKQHNVVSLGRNGAAWNRFAEGIVPKRNALGTAYFGGGATLVGEYGPELVNLPRGSQVLSNNQTQQAMSGDRNVTVNLNVAGNVLGNREFFDEMIRMMASELRVVMPQY